MLRQALLAIVMTMLCVPSFAETAEIYGAWRQTSSLEWIKSPPEIEIPVRSASAAILYFGSGHVFVLVHGWVIQQEGREALSVGDPRTVYLGTWSQDGETLRLTYRLVDRMINYPPSPIPGPVKTGTAVVGKTMIRFDHKRFARKPQLDADLLQEIGSLRFRFPQYFKHK